jgi:hypothetical protein
MKKPYKNAEEILPLKLLQELQRYHYGLLWVPKPGGARWRRDERIERLYRQGTVPADIAREVELSERRVRQILRERGVAKQTRG